MDYASSAHQGLGKGGVVPRCVEEGVALFSGCIEIRDRGSKLVFPSVPERGGGRVVDVVVTQSNDKVRNVIKDKGGGTDQMFWTVL